VTCGDAQSGLGSGSRVRNVSVTVRKVWRPAGDAILDLGGWIRRNACCGCGGHGHL